MVFFVSKGNFTWSVLKFEKILDIINLIRYLSTLKFILKW